MIFNWHQAKSRISVQEVHIQHLRRWRFLPFAKGVFNVGPFQMKNCTTATHSAPTTIFWNKEDAKDATFLVCIKKIVLSRCEGGGWLSEEQWYVLWVNPWLVLLEFQSDFYTVCTTIKAVSSHIFFSFHFVKKTAGLVQTFFFGKTFLFVRFYGSYYVSYLGSYSPYLYITSSRGIGCIFQWTNFAFSFEGHFFISDLSQNNTKIGRKQMKERSLISLRN